MPSLRCLISALTQASGGDLLFRFLVQFSPAAGRAGHCRQTSLCGEHSPCSGHSGFAPHRGVCALPVCTAQAPGCSIRSGPCAACGSSLRGTPQSADSVAPACCAFPGPSSSGSQELDGRPLSGCDEPSPFHSPSLFLPAPVARVSPVFPSRRMSTIQNLRKSLDRSVCSVGGDAVSGAQFAPFPNSRLPTSGGDGPVRLRLALLWSFSVPVFCERLAHS